MYSPVCVLCGTPLSPVIARVSLALLGPLTVTCCLDLAVHPHLLVSLALACLSETPGSHLLSGSPCVSGPPVSLALTHALLNTLALP